MHLPRSMKKEDLIAKFVRWIDCWNRHDLEGVLEWMDNSVVFEHWTGSVVCGKNSLRKIWVPWFFSDDNFRFITEDIYIDETQQKLTFMWELKWLSKQKGYEGQPETRRGVDLIFFSNEKIVRKISYSKTSVLINNKPITS